MESKKRFSTVYKADVFSVSLGVVMFSVEASHRDCRVVTFETDDLKLQNVVDLKEHASVEEAKEYQEICSNAYHDRKQLEKEQGI